MDLLKDNIKKLYFKYLVPSLGSAIVISIYLMTDAIVIGKGLGNNALAALNLTIPLICFMFATGILFGVGSSVHFSIQNGMKNSKKANSYFTSAFIAELIFSAILFIFSNLYISNIIISMGAKGELYQLTFDYLKYYCYIAIPTVFVNFFSIMIRSDKDPNRAMIAVISGGIVNIALDIILVYVINLGMQGPAIASTSGVLVQLIICLTHFLSKKNTIKFAKPYNFLIQILQILKSGISGFVTELSNAVIVFVFNIQVLSYLGEIALAVYGVMANCAIFFNALFTGVGQSVQPISSFNYGAKKINRVLKLKKYGYITTVIMGLIFSLSGIVFPKEISACFMELNNQTLQIVEYSVPIYFIAFLPMGINVFSTYFFQSVMFATQSFAISILRNIVLSSIFLLTFPLVFGGKSLWFVIPVVETIVVIICVFINKISNKFGND